MISYLDRSFCSSDCINTKCSRNFTPEHKARAQSLDLPASFADYKAGCADYVSKPAPYNPPRKKVK